MENNDIMSTCYEDSEDRATPTLKIHWSTEDWKRYVCDKCKRCEWNEKRNTTKEYLYKITKKKNNENKWKRCNHMAFKRNDCYCNGLQQGCSDALHTKKWW